MTEKTTVTPKYLEAELERLVDEMHRKDQEDATDFDRHADKVIRLLRAAHRELVRFAKNFDFDDDQKSLLADVHGLAWVVQFGHQCIEGAVSRLYTKAELRTMYGRVLTRQRKATDDDPPSAA